MSLYIKYRPTDLESVKGNETIVASLEKMLSKPATCPHVFLFHGATGCGKTTLGRILAARLGCVGSDLREIDSADFRGIDMVREIRKNSQYKPLQGDVRVWIMDECFSKGTQINTPLGNKSIENLKSGDSVYSLFGEDKIKSVFTNKISLERVIKLKFINGSVLYCSADHLFFTKKGWVKAIELNKNTLLLPFDSQFMTTLNSQNNDTDKTVLQKMSQITKENTEILLFSQLFQFIKSSLCKNGMEKLFSLWEACFILFRLETEKQFKILQQYLCREIQFSTQFGIITNEGIQTEKLYCKETFFNGNRGRFISTTNAFKANDYKQPVNESTYSSKREGNEKDQWHSQCVVGITWWERIFNNISKIVSNSFRLVYGSNYKNRTLPNGSFRISNELQSGYRKSEIENSNRSGWKRTQIERSYLTGFEENKEIEFIRLESSEIYQQGNNDRSFQGIITDQERDQGFVNFYDLEVENHPSYFAEGVSVHNCHKLTSDAQNALLKILEDTPPHIYFILCTTDPQKLISTIRGRCIEMQVKPLTDIQMKGLLRGIVREEGEKLDAEVYAQIIQDSQGHPRNAIQILEQVLNVDEDMRLTVAQRTAEMQSQSIELCRLLLKQGSGWKEIKTVLAGLKDQETEDIRRVVMGYCSAVLLKADHNRAAMVLEYFIEPFYNSGFPGLVFVCYQIVKS